MTHQIVWSWPVVAEEFLFGLAAGVFIVAALLDLRRSPEERANLRGVLRGSFIIAGIAAIIGQLVLLLELGHGPAGGPFGPFQGAFRATPGIYSENPLGVLANAAVLGTSVLSKTSIILIIFTVPAIIVGAAWLVYPRRSSAAIRVIEAIGLILAVPTALQAGLLLQAVTPRVFWGTAVFPYLYLISGVLAGIGVVGLLLARKVDAFRETVSSLLTYSLLLIIIQSGALVAHFAIVEAPAEVFAILAGPPLVLAFILPTFYVGVLGLGMLVPGGYAVRIVRKGIAPSASASSVIFLLLIIGSLALRIAFLFAGQVV